MQLTAIERYRLEILLAWRRRPPTWRRLVPRAAAGIAIYSGFGFFLIWALPPDVKHPHLKYILIGAVSYSIWTLLCLLVGVALRWRLTDAIINWQRVEELHAAAKRKGV